MTTMYDAANPNNIPADAPVVAGYIAGTHYVWPPASWSRFSGAKVRIVVYQPGHEPANDGDVLDVEAKDADRAHRDGVVDRWVAARRAASHPLPCIYTSRSTWPFVVGPNRCYWIADYTGKPHLLAGSVATQYDHPPHSGGGYDLSETDGIWPHSVQPSQPGAHMNGTAVAILPTRTGGGYYVIASDGGVFTYGNAIFHGSAGGTHLNKPITGAALTSSGEGYWLLAGDGGVFAYGDATFHGDPV